MITHGSWAASNMGNFNKSIPLQEVSDCKVLDRGLGFLIFGILGALASLALLIFELYIVFWISLSIFSVLILIGTVKLSISKKRKKH